LKPKASYKFLRKDRQKKSAIGAGINEGRREVEGSVIGLYLLEMRSVKFLKTSGILKLNHFIII
jgi:hypothetical protein